MASTTTAGGEAQTFIIEAPYRIYYNTEKPVPIDLIIDTLISMERMLKRTPPFIEAAFEGIHIIETEVLVSSIVAGSLTQDFIVKYVFGGQKNVDNAKKVFDDIVKDSAPVKTVVALGVGALIGYGASVAIPTGSGSTHIEAHNSTVINVTGQGSLTSEAVKAILDGTKDKGGLAKDAVTILKPAKLDSASSVELGIDNPVVLTPQFISEVPAEYVKPVPQERESTYANVDVIIYASDRDRAEQGWAGIIPELFDKRVTFKLSEKIPPSQLHGRTRVKADVVVHEKYVSAKKAYEIKWVEILTVN